MNPPTDTSRRIPNVALMLSGGGARGAYEAGVLSGLAHVLGAHAAPWESLFDLVLR